MLIYGFTKELRIEDVIWIILSNNRPYVMAPKRWKLANLTLTLYAATVKYFGQFSYKSIRILKSLGKILKNRNEE